MTPEDRNDDPTRALDDFVRRMRPPTPEPAAPDLSDLLGRLAPERPSAAAAPARGGRLRSGETWRADDVVDVPHVEVPPVAPPKLRAPEIELPQVAAPATAEPRVELPAIDAAPLPDAAALDAACRSANDAAAAQFDDAQRVDASWQPDAAALAPAAPTTDTRLLRDWKPGAWIGAQRLVLDTLTEFVTTPAGPVVETYPPHRLLLLWPPQRLDEPLLGRWPAQVLLCAASADEAAARLLAALPADAELWLTPQGVDWGLMAELLLHHDPALRPFQLKGLRAFVDAEREATFARVNAGYRQIEPGGPVEKRE